jgi:hypothetical protein
MTPLLSGLFLLSAVTGVLMFLHLASPLARGSHEWVSWGLVAVAALHVVLNWKALLVALRPTLAKAAVAGLTLFTLVAAALPSSQGGGGVNPGQSRAATEAVMSAPLGRVAALMDTDAAQLRQKLEARGLQVPGEAPSLKEIVQANAGKAPAVLETVFGASGPPSH